MIVRAYRVLQHLSIDIVFGAVILLHFFSGTYGVSPNWPGYVLLGSAIWLIYTIDHLRDAKSAVAGKRERYVFHAKNERAIKIGAIGVLLISTICLFLVPLYILIAGGVLSLFCVIYVFLHGRLARLNLKELYISLVYTSGILLVPIASTRSVDWHSLIILFVLTFLNLIIFSWFEIEEDRADSFKSIATQLGKQKLAKTIFVVLSIGFAFGFSAIHNFSLVTAYLILVLIIYVLLMFNEQWSKQKSRYRAIGDAVFILPVLFEIL